MSVGVFAIVKNEAPWIGFCVMALKDLVSEFVYFDGNSTDGTLELLDYIRSKYGLHIRVFKDRDPKDLRDDYTRVFDDCMKQVKSEYVWYVHPDMILVKNIKPDFLKSKALAYYVGMRSFGGEPHGKILEITEGRTDKWKTIMANRFDLHYHGHYGAHDEDMYFREITGSQYGVYKDFSRYPFDVEDSGVTFFHYSDVRPYGRRLSRMMTCMANQVPGASEKYLMEMSANHPRVSLSPGGSFGAFTFKEHTDFPLVFYNHGYEFVGVLGKTSEELCWLFRKPDRNPFYPLDCTERREKVNA